VHGLQAARRTRSLTRHLPLAAAAAATLVADQVTKQLAVDRLADGPVTVVEGVLQWRLTFNSGGAFGLLQGFPGLFLAATVVVIFLLLVWARRVEERVLAIPLGLVVGGGLGNLADRIWRDFDGRVVDFVDLHFWPVFNLADSAIVIGVLWLVAAAVLADRRRPAKA
jgi:signal peptidase II